MRYGCFPPSSTWTEALARLINSPILVWLIQCQGIQGLVDPLGLQAYQSRPVWRGYRTVHALGLYAAYHNVVFISSQ